MIRLTMLLLLIRFGIPLVPAVVSPATGDPVMIIAAVVGVSVVAMIVLSILSKRGKGGRRR